MKYISPFVVWAEAIAHVVVLQDGGVHLLRLVDAATASLLCIAVVEMSLLMQMGKYFFFPVIVI